MKIEKIKKLSYFKQTFEKYDKKMFTNTYKDDIIEKNEFNLRKSLVFHIAQLYIFATDSEFEECLKKCINKNYENYEDRFISQFGRKKGKEMMLKASENMSKSQIGIKKSDRLKNHKEYWLKRGFNEEESFKKAGEFQSLISKKRHSKMTSEKYKEDNPLCIEYWKKRYKKNFEEKHQNHLKTKFNLSKDYMIEHYGENGYKDFIEKRKELCREGIVRKGYSFSSKASIKQFIPIYKYLRRNGYKSDDIYWGIGNRKEYFLLHEKNYPYFYDFVIKSKKILIEYNGNAFHPKNLKDENYRAHLFKKGKTHLEMIEKDNKKIALAEKHGFNVLVIWDTDSFDKNIELMKEFIDEHT